MFMRFSMMISVSVLLIAGCDPNGSQNGPKPDGGQHHQSADAQNGQTDPVLTGWETDPFLKDDENFKPKRESAVVFEPRTVGLPTSGNWKCEPAIADVNEDGEWDLAGLPRVGSGPHIWLGDGGETWTEIGDAMRYGTDSCGGGLAFGDVNNDGHLDLAVGDHCNGSWIYLGDGAGDFEIAARNVFPAVIAPPTDRGEYIGTEDMDLGDVNSDGNLDMLVIAAGEGGINVLLGDGTGRNWKRVDSGLPARHWGTRASFMDVNEDGMLDVVASYKLGPRVYLGDGTGVFLPGSEGLPSPQLGGIYHSHTMADFNNDGLMDLAFANWYDGPEVYLQQFDGSWVQADTVFPECIGGAVGIDAGDITRDGNVDLVVSGRITKETGRFYGVFLLEGDGKGGFTWVGDNNLPSTDMDMNYGVRLKDLDKDGWLDVVLASGGIVATNKESPPQTALPARFIVWRTVPR